MSLTTVIIPCLSDNYAYLLRDAATGKVAVVDVPDHAPIEAALKDRGWALDTILVTHHHYDHIDGVEPLRKSTGARVVGAKADAHRLPRLDLALTEGDTVAIGDSVATVIDVSGHTVGHIAYYFPRSGQAFTADSLMALGCGRVFEGTPAMMWQSLSKLAALPPATMIYSGHEYTQSNARFALTIDPTNAALKDRAALIERIRAEGQPTVPVPLAEELATNPFLRPGDPAIRAGLGMPDEPDAEVFAEIRRRKDSF